MIARLLISFVIFGCLSIGPAWAQQPNVLLVIADDLGVDSLNLFVGNDGPPTPTLDSMANAGVQFTNCWGSPSCSPARAQMLTGRYGFRTGVGAPGAVPSVDEGTIAQAFKAGGYATACLGKWHLSNATNGGNDNPNLMGFDHYSGSIGGGVGDYSSWNKVENGIQTNGRNNPVTNYVTSETASDASNWIAQQGNNPWFCWVAFNAPHSPFHLPPANLHSSTLPGTAADIAANPRDYYLAMVEAMDTEIGRMLNEIDPAVLANTVVVFIGDNGTPGQVPPAPRVLTGSKGSLFEGGVNIPCIVSGAGVVAPDRTHDGLISVVDLFATLLDMAGLDASLIPDGAATDSLSFAACLTDPNASIARTCQFTETFANPGATPGRSDGKTVRLGDWKLIRSDNGNEGLYNLPNENQNLANGFLTATEQENFDLLNRKLDAILTDSLLGDVSLNGVVDFSDISPFIARLSSGVYQLEADCDRSGAVDFSDIPRFIEILQNQ